METNTEVTQRVMMQHVLQCEMEFHAREEIRNAAQDAVKAAGLILEAARGTLKVHQQEMLDDLRGA